MSDPKSSCSSVPGAPADTKDIGGEPVVVAEPCPNCGMREKHWVNTDDSAFGLFFGDGGFWICAKLYGPDGRRIE